MLVYDAFGQLAEYRTNSASAPPCRTCYLTSDHLGSVQVVTDGNGQVVSLHDYLPWGEEIPNGQAGRNGAFGAGDGVPPRFTGQERDAETGLDFFDARYYGGALGRFTSPDDPLNDQYADDPQSWNLYSYGRNNPLINVDPTGRACIYSGAGNVNDSGNYSDDNSGGQGCADAFSWQQNSTVSATVNAQQGSWLSAVGTNAFLSFSNAANSYFSFIAPNSQLLSQTPTGQGTAAQIGNGIGIAATLIGPGGEVEGAAQGASRLWSRGVKNAFQHWIKHGREFPNLQNAKQYVEAAQEFVTNPPPGTLSKLRASGDTILYNPVTNTFAVKTADGVPRTMFKPNNGLTYFNAQ